MCDTGDNKESRRVTKTPYDLQAKQRNANQKNSPRDPLTAYAPKKDLQRRHDENKTKLHHTKTNHKTGTTTPQRPQHQKTNEHILAARVRDTFSMQPWPSHGHRLVHTTDHKPRQLQSKLNITQIRTKPILYYSITSKSGHTIQQNRKRIISMMHLQGCIKTHRVTHRGIELLQNV